MKRTILAMLAVFVLWGVLDFLLHGVLLTPMYVASAPLWRPMAEIKLWLIYLATLISAICFVYVYAEMLADHTMAAALRYGLIFGIGAGVSAGIGSYAVMPISGSMAAIWCLGLVVEALLGAWLAWAILHRGQAAGSQG